MIDPKVPLFQRRMFEDFIGFMRSEWEAGRRILIHCNKGESRSPTLAILFLSKVLYRLTAESFDHAADEFEVLTQERYRPSAGIDQWMREHWDDFLGGRRLPSMDKPPSEPVRPVLPAITPEAGAQLVRSNPLIHFAGFTQIETKEHVWQNPLPNALQYDIAAAYQFCLEEGIACRLIILKPRQVGCSTFCGEVCYHHMRRVQSDMIIMGDVAKRTEKVWTMFQDIEKRDTFGWDSTIVVSNTEKIRFSYADGSEGLVEHDTALDPKAGISGTRQVVWLTEAARYMKTGGRDKKVITAVLNSLPNAKNTICMAESTAEGAHGWFYETHQGAVSLEDRRKGVIGNGWIKVFAPWFAFQEHQLECRPENADYFDGDLDERERRGIDLYQWSDQQIAWRRMKIKADCANDSRMFDQDFPEDPQSCFLASGRPRFDLDAIAKLEKVARVTHGLAETGVLEINGSAVNFMPRGTEDWLWCCERPTPGCAYIGFVDPCMGEQSEGSLFPDAHAPGILRAGYFDERQVWHNTRLVAAMDVPNGCRWPDEVLAERMKRLLDWYGGCMVVPEIGNGLGVLNELRRQGCQIYQREKMDRMRPGEKLEVVGWETNKDTRPIVVNAMANFIRERRIDLSYQPAIEELKTFIINDRGRAEAKSGCHDDWPMGIGIGLANIELAQVLMPPVVFSLGEHGDAANALPCSGMSSAAFS